MADLADKNVVIFCIISLIFCSTSHLSDLIRENPLTGKIRPVFYPAIPDFYFNSTSSQQSREGEKWLDCYRNISGFELDTI